MSEKSTTWLGYPLDKLSEEGLELLQHTITLGIQRLDKRTRKRLLDPSVMFRDLFVGTLDKEHKEKPDEEIVI